VAAEPHKADRLIRLVRHLQKVARDLSASLESVEAEISAMCGPAVGSPDAPDTSDPDLRRDV
jgi:hypothetical protein